MARRRLNKRVALLGSAVLLLLVLLAVFVFFRLNRDPAPFIADGDAAWAAQDYEAARENYGQAYALTDDPSLKVDLLFKLSDVYRATDQWEKVLRCWETVLTTDPQNVRANLGRLKYFYILADSLGNAGRGMSGYWEEVLSQARRTLEVVEDADLLNAPRAEWEPSFGAVKEGEWSRGTAVMGPHLRFVKGRAALELAAMGAGTMPGELLDEAQADLEEAGKLDARNAQIYHYLSQVFVERGKLAASTGNRNDQAAAEKRADEILAEGVNAAPDDPEAHVHVLARRLAQVDRQETVADARQQMQTMEPEYEALTQRFASSAQAHAAQARFYSFFAAYLDSASARGKLDKAIEAAQHASSLDSENVEYAILAAGCQYRKASTYDDPTALLAAIDLAEDGLKSPEAQDTPGPTQTARRFNRLSLCSLLARCCVERILALPESDPTKADLLARAEEAVRQIRQIRGSGENPEVLKWQGMMDLARGRTNQAVQSLYAAYEQIKAANPADQRDPFLAQTLARIFKETAETGAVIDFLGSALSSGILHTKPDVLLDYGDALLRAGSYDTVISATDSFEERFGQNSRSRTLRIKALIAKGYITDAEKALAGLSPDDPDAIVLNLDMIRTKTTQLLSAIHQEKMAGGGPLAPGATGQELSEAVRAMTAELRGYHRREAELTQRLLQVDSDAVEERHVVRLCESLIEQGDTATAQTVVDAVLKQSPDSLGAGFYRGLLAEPDPRNCPESRRDAIRAQAIRGLSDPVRRALELGAFYQQSEQADQAAAQWRSVLDATASESGAGTPGYLKSRDVSPRRAAAGYLFDLARHQEDWKLAEEMVELAQRENLDDCGGYLYRARLAFAREQYDTALSHLDECLKQRPVFSYGYMLRGNVKAALGKDLESVEDVRTAARLNPMDPTIARALANALYLRNRKLGDNASSEQQLEVRQALERAIHLSPRDPGLLSVYADLIGDSDPMKALAIRQTIQANVPNLHNAVMLGRLATQAGQKETDERKRSAFFNMAGAAFEQAKQMDPSDQLMLESYAAYYRVRGQNDKAQQLLVESNDSRLLWRHYFRLRDFDEARRLLMQLYEQGGDARIDALKGLLLVAEETSDKQGVKKHSDELLALEDSTVNRLAQLRAYLSAGLIGEAERKLQSFKERYPNEPGVLLLEAQLAKRQGQLQRALGLVNRALENDQQNAVAWRLRGDVSLLTGDEERAILDYHKSRTLQDDPGTTISLAKAYIWAGRNDEAVTELRSVVEQSQAPQEAALLLEATYLKLKRHDALNQLYTEALAKSPENVFWLNRAGEFALDQGRYQQAEESFLKACRIQEQAAGGTDAVAATSSGPYSASLDGYFRAIIRGVGQSDKLNRLFVEAQKYVETPYAPVAFFRMAEAKKTLGDMDAARGYARQAADSSWAKERLAVEVLLRISMLLGEQEASGYCRQRLATEPGSVAAHFVLFNLAKIQDKYSEAVDHIDKCIALAGPETQAGIEYTVAKADLLTTAYKKTSDKSYLARAVAVYESLNARMPKNSSVLNNLAYMLAQNDQRLAEALEYAQTAVEQSPDVASYLDTYGYVLHKNGRHAEAAEAVTAAIQQYEVQGGPSLEVYEHLGLVNEALGQRNKAQTAYRRALEVGGSAMPDTARQRLNAAMQRLAQ